MFLPSLLLLLVFLFPLSYKIASKSKTKQEKKNNLLNPNSLFDNPAKTCVEKLKQHSNMQRSVVGEIKDWLVINIDNACDDETCSNSMKSI